MIPLLSLRAALERFGGPVRTFIALLAVLSFVAPSWHLCALGGMAAHSAHSPSEHGEHQSRFQTTKSGAVLCVCAPRDDHSTPENAPLLSATPHHDHQFCLAQLLDNYFAVPADFGSIRVVKTARQRQFFARPTFFQASAFRRDNARGPPRNL